MKRISIGSLIEENGLTEDSKILMPKNLADGEMTLLTSENGLSLYKVDIKAKEDFISESVFSKDMLSFSFLLQGSTYYRNNNL
ncbi:MAG: hypothetical protein OIF32_07690, partial [Campylobacterales bacterium]|nr:hypothetical protein [Campylobacterales bacterium]